MKTYKILTFLFAFTTVLSLFCAIVFYSHSEDLQRYYREERHNLSRAEYRILELEEENKGLWNDANRRHEYSGNAKTPDFTGAH